MGIQDGLPDRPLKDSELHALQDQDSFDSVLTADKPGPIDTLFCTLDGTEHILQYDEEQGWHKTDQPTF